MQDDVTVSPLKAFFRQKWVKVVLGLNVGVILVVIGIAIYNSTKTAVIVLDVAPVDAKITINGNDNYSNGTYKMSPGFYSVNISHEGLDSKNFEFDLANRSSVLLSTFLSADGGKDFSFYEKRENYDSAQRLFSIASPEYNQTFDHDLSAEKFVGDYSEVVNTFNNTLPIVESLRESPDDGGRLLSTISIQKNESCAKYLCVLVSSFGISDIKSKTNELLENVGIDLKYLEIKYENN